MPGRKGSRWEAGAAPLTGDEIRETTGRARPGRAGSRKIREPGDLVRAETDRPAESRGAPRAPSVRGRDDAGHRSSDVRVRALEFGTGGRPGSSDADGSRSGHRDENRDAGRADRLVRQRADARADRAATGDGRAANPQRAARLLAD